MTAGTSAIISIVLDLLPFVLWLAGIVTGHRALKQTKREGGQGRNQAVWGLVLNYLGLIFSSVILIVIAILIFAGIGVGLFYKIIPFIHK
jgi:threonine/homoserine efflux transporter RhtA